VYIEIPKIKAAAKIIDNISPFEKTEYEQALQNGVARFGNLYFAHSSLPPWQITRVNTPFLFLNKLSIGDEIFIYEQNTKKIFKVYDKKIIFPDDLSHIQELKNDNQKLILMTCTPWGTDLKRLLIFADVVEKPQITSDDNPSETPVPTSIPEFLNPEFTLKKFIYPGAEITKQSPNNILFQTSSDIVVVTNWYEEKVSELGFSATSVIRTNTNGQVLNKIVAANSEYEIVIEIQNQQGVTSVKIDID